MLTSYSYLFVYLVRRLCIAMAFQQLFSHAHYIPLGPFFGKLVFHCSKFHCVATCVIARLLVFSGGRLEASKRNLNFQSATWHHTITYGYILGMKVRKNRILLYFQLSTVTYSSKSGNLKKKSFKA
jgi:hypothetical protein